MEKKFKCQSCGQSFIGDTSRYVTCPNCKSDNVSLDNDRGKIYKYCLIALGAIALVVLVVFAVKAFMDRPSQEEVDTTELTPDTPETDDSGVSAQEVEAVQGNMAPEIVFESAAQPKYDAATETYSLTVKAKMMGDNSGKYKILYTLTTLNEVEIAKSDDGKFTRIPPIADKSNPDCSYIVFAQALLDGKPVENGKISKVVAGFVVVPKAASVPKLTVAQVQALIDRKAGAAELNSNPSLAHPCAVRCQGTMDNAASVKSLNKLIERLDMDDDMSAKVVSLEYDEVGRVKCVVFTPVFK